MDDDPVTRRELDQRIDALKDLITQKFEALTKLQEAEATALVLQREIDQTHFETLNHEAARIQAVQATTVPREVFEIFKTDQLTRWEQLYTRLNNELEARRQELSKESETRRQELTPLRNAERFEAGRNLGLISLSFTVGAAVAGIAVKLLVI